MLCIERSTGLFHFWRFWAAYLMLCTQDVPLHFTESDDDQPNRKRSHEAAHQLHDTANRVTVQSIRTDGKYFTNPASIDFSHLISSPFSRKSLWIRLVYKVFTVSFEKTSWQRRLELNQSWWSGVANTYPYFWLIGWIYVRFRVEKQGLFLL